MPAQKTGNFDPKLQSQLDNILGYMLQSSPPSTAKSSGNSGEIAFDSNYIYVCVAKDTCKRCALAAWEVNHDTHPTFAKSRISRRNEHVAEEYLFSRI